MADNGGERPLVIDESERTHTIDDLVRLRIWSTINPIVALRPPGYVYKLLLNRQVNTQAPTEGGPEVMDQDVIDSGAASASVMETDMQQATGGDQPQVVVDPERLLDPNMPPFTPPPQNQARPPPTSRQSARRTRVTTNRPVIRNYDLGSNVETTTSLAELSQRAREAAARRAIELEENNPNKVIYSCGDKFLLRGVRLNHLSLSRNVFLAGVEASR